MPPTAPMLAAAIQAARQAHSGLSVPDEVFAAFVTRRLDAGELDADAAARNAGDLLLACAAATGAADALAEIERACIATIDAAVGGIVASDLVDEVKQRLRLLLFVAPPGKIPKIDSYAGRGPLRSWVRATAIRVALGVRRECAVEPPEDAALYLGVESATTDEDPGMRALRHHHALQFREAFEAAMHALEPRDRTVLRQHFVDGIGTEDLARLHGVHRVTMFRWLARLRRQLLTRTRRELSARIAVSRGELDGIMRAVRSRVDLTLERVLASEA